MLFLYIIIDYHSEREDFIAIVEFYQAGPAGDDARRGGGQARTDKVPWETPGSRHVQSRPCGRC